MPAAKYWHPTAQFGKGWGLLVADERVYGVLKVSQIVSVKS